MEQLLNIKKVAMDSECKVTVTLEFEAKTEASRQNVFHLIECQGELVKCSIEPVQATLPLQEGAGG